MSETSIPKTYSDSASIPTVECIRCNRQWALWGESIPQFVNGECGDCRIKDIDLPCGHFIIEVPGALMYYRSPPFNLNGPLPKAECYLVEKFIPDKIQLD